MAAPNNYRMLFGLILLILLCFLFALTVLGKPIPQTNQALIMPLIVVLATGFDRFAQWAFHRDKDDKNDKPE